MRRGTWISLALLLLSSLACSPPGPTPPPDVESLAQGARWEGAGSEVALGEAIDMRLWIVVDIEQVGGAKAALDPALFASGSLLMRKNGPEIENARLEPTGDVVRNLREGRLLVSRPYRLTWLRMGEQTLPSFEIRVRGGDIKLSTQSLDFEVAGVLTAEDGKDAELPTDLLQEAPTSYRLLYWILGVVVLALVIGWWLQHRLKGRMHEVDAGPRISAIEEARQRLRQVEIEWKEQQLDGESLVVAVSAVLRTYLQKGLGFHSLTHTTEEFLEELRSSDLVPMTVQTPMAAFLQQCDLIKFAAQGSDAELSRSLLETTHALLDDAEKLEARQARVASTQDPVVGLPESEELVHRG